MLKIDQDFAGIQIQGERPYQEDAQGFASLVENTEGQVEVLLAVLADGMGGENAGGHASVSAVRSIVDYCHHLGVTENVMIPDMLRSATEEATLDLSLAIQSDPLLGGMGTTLLAVVVTNDVLYWISVGDSPLYLYRKGVIEQINEDHSMMPLLVQEVEQGYMDERMLEFHPDRNALRSALTGHDVEMIDCPTEGLSLLPGDIIVVASDGVQSLSENEISSCVEEHENRSAEEISKELIDAVSAMRKPRQDNTSINVIKISE